MVKTRSGSSSKNLQFLLYFISGFDVMSRLEVFFGGKGGIVGGDQSNRRDRRDRSNRSNQSYRNYRSNRRGGGGIGDMGRPRVGDRGVG